MRGRRSTGNWLYVALGTTSGKKFRVTEGGIVPVRLGPPLLVNVTYRKTEELRRGTRVFKRGQPKAGDTIKLSLTLSGQGAEKYDWLARDGKRPPVPTYRIIDEAGKTVASGTFEYG